MVPPSDPERTSSGSGDAMRRVLVELDASPLGLAALEAAIRLAAELQLQLQAEITRDEQLLEVAASPFNWEIQYASAARRQLDPAALRRQLETRLAALQRRIEELAAQARVPCQLTLRAAAPRTPSECYLDGPGAGRSSTHPVISGCRERGRRSHGPGDRGGSGRQK